MPFWTADWLQRRCKALFSLLQQDKEAAIYEEDNDKGLK